MKKLFWLSLALFYVVPFLILFFNPDVLSEFQSRVYTSDILFPFSIYSAFTNPSSNSDWVFGGYTPFLELVIGFIFWVITQNLNLTFLMYAVLQPVLITISLVFLSTAILGRNKKIIILAIIMSIAPVYLCTLGVFDTGWDLFIWYRHGTTLCFSLIAVAFLVQLITTSAVNKHRIIITGGLLSLVIVVSALSDALFISQFIIPSIATLIILWLFQVLTFRRAAYSVLFILYSCALGLSLYQLPSLWGSDRIIVYGSYVQFSFERLSENIRILAILFNNIFQGSILIGAVWLLFYALCLAYFFTKIRQRRQALGIIRTKLFILACFLLFQLGSTILSSLFTTTPGVRYVLPIVYIPIFWGWAFIGMALPNLLKSLRRNKLNYATAFLSVVPILMVIGGNLSFQNIQRLTSYSTEFVNCVDQYSQEYSLQRGVANYWQARLITLLSKNGVEVVQVTPDLAPFRILNNSDGYREDFDFVIITHNPEPGLWMDRQYVIDAYGNPALSLFCGVNEIMIYNRESDGAFRRNFDRFFSLEN